MDYPESEGNDTLHLLEDVLLGDFREKEFHWKYAMPLTIKRAIIKVKSYTVDVDGISLGMLKMTILSLMPILEHLFNFSLANDVFPRQWKSALICPILKKHPTTVEHYRPISILPTLLKVLERVTCEQIRAYLEEADLYDPCSLPIERQPLHANMPDTNVR